MGVHVHVHRLYPLSVGLHVELEIISFLSC